MHNLHRGLIPVSKQCLCPQMPRQAIDSLNIQENIQETAVSSREGPNQPRHWPRRADSSSSYEAHGPDQQASQRPGQLWRARRPVGLLETDVDDAAGRVGEGDGARGETVVVGDRVGETALEGGALVAKRVEDDARVNRLVLDLAAHHPIPRLALLPELAHGAAAADKDNLVVVRVDAVGGAVAVTVVVRRGGEVLVDRLLEGADPAPDGGAALGRLAQVAGHLADAEAGGAAACTRPAGRRPCPRRAARRRGPRTGQPGRGCGGWGAWAGPPSRRQRRLDVGDADETVCRAAHVISCGAGPGCAAVPFSHRRRCRRPSVPLRIASCRRWLSRRDGPARRLGARLIGPGGSVVLVDGDGQVHAGPARGGGNAERL